jgi:maltooligosyltrehalose trehalohydrolase
MSGARAAVARVSPDGVAPIGAVPEAGGTRFRVIAPDAEIEVVVESTDGPDRVEPLTVGADGVHECFVEGVAAGARYRYRLNGRQLLPDPASRWQPEGVHGPSEVVDSSTFTWKHSDWAGRTLERMVIYELHVGTFTPAGSFAAAIERLTYLRVLGATAIELMPIHEFPGERSWGYDPAALFAPAHCYGTPDTAWGSRSSSTSSITTLDPMAPTPRRSTRAC